MSASPAEKEFNDALMRAKQGLPSLPIWDKYLIQTDFGTRRPDFSWPDLKLAVEINGQAYHTRHNDFNRDHRRRRALQRVGWMLIEFTASEVLSSADACVVELFEMRGWKYPTKLSAIEIVRKAGIGGTFVRSDRVIESSSVIKPRKLGNL